MKACAVNFNELGDRMDAGFHCLREEHKPLVTELMEKFTKAEIIELARKLPYDNEAAHCVCPRMGGSTFGGSRGQATFEEYLASIEKKASLLPSKHRDVAVYVAAAITGAKAKVMEEILAIYKQGREKAEQLRDIAKIAGRSEVLKAVLKGATNV